MRAFLLLSLLQRRGPEVVQVKLCFENGWEKNDQEICCSLSDTAAEGAAAAMRLPATWTSMLF